MAGGGRGGGGGGGGGHLGQVTCGVEVAELIGQERVVVGRWWVLGRKGVVGCKVFGPIYLGFRLLFIVDYDFSISLI